MTAMLAQAAANTVTQWPAAAEAKFKRFAKQNDVASHDRSPYVGVWACDMNAGRPSSTKLQSDTENQGFDYSLFGILLYANAVWNFTSSCVAFWFWWIMLNQLKFISEVRNGEHRKSSALPEVAHIVAHRMWLLNIGFVWMVCCMKTYIHTLSLWLFGREGGIGNLSQSWVNCLGRLTAVIDPLVTAHYCNFMHGAKWQQHRQPCLHSKCTRCSAFFWEHRTLKYT